jgi:diguanylate cyclase (GGDEF)-like protein
MIAWLFAAIAGPFLHAAGQFVTRVPNEQEQRNSAAPRQGVDGRRRCRAQPPARNVTPPRPARFLARLKFTSLRQRLMVINLIATGATLLLVSLALIGNAYLTYRGSLLETLRVHAEQVGKSAGAVLAGGDNGGAAKLLSTLSSAPEIDQAAIFDASGRTVATYRAPGEPLSLVPYARTIASEHIGFTTVELAAPIFHDKARVGSIRIEANFFAVYQRVAWYTVVLVLAGIGAIGMTTLLTDRLLTSASRPLVQLADLMEKVSNEKDFSVRADVHEHDEVGALAAGFNRMLKRIQEREHALKRELHERKRAERRLATLANYDALTRLPNRNFFSERLANLIARASRSGQPIALLFLDLDNFKIVNDTLGHHLGDSLLKAVAERVRGCVRAGDSVCRLGGDEFTIILEELKTADLAGQVAAKVVAALSQPFLLRDNEVYVTCSIGISVYPRDGRDAATLIKSGDTAMYHAKERGKNTFQFFSPDMNDRAIKRLTIETGLRQALERSEFLLYYQPQIDLASGEVVGAEALLRWNRAGLGVVGPGEFIPVAEETGMIVPIGEWILWSACSQANLWQQSDNAVRVSVNLSARQFREPGFVRTIANVLEETRLDPTLLELELTESVLMEDVDGAIAKAQDLRAMGVLLSIDDFGTGYSSMSYLKRFPINEIKIDRSFISDIPANADDAAITTAIVAMARGLAVEVVAEGVETQQQIDFLTALGCHRAQGFYIGRALPAAEFEERLRQRRSGRRWIPDHRWPTTDAA